MKNILTNCWIDTVGYLKKQPPEAFCKKGALKNFANFTGKHLRWSLFLIKLQVRRHASFLKRDSNAGVFLVKFPKLFRKKYLWTSAHREKYLKVHEWESYGYSHLFSMNWVKVFPYIWKSIETSFPYLGIVWVFKFNRFLTKTHSMGVYKFSP